MLDEETRDRVAKLPTWARNTIRKLDLDCDRLRQEIADMTGEDSPIWHTPDYQTKLHLPKRTTVVFALANGEVELDLREGDIHVLANAKHNCRVFIMPDISNGFTIGVEEL